MKASLFIFLCCVTLISFDCCKKKSTNQIAALSIPIDSPGVTIQIDSFPLKVGNQWIYKVVEQQTVKSVLQSPDSFNFTITVVADTYLYNIRFVKIEGSSSDPYSFLSIYMHHQSNGTYYYANLSRGLYQFASLDNIDTAHMLDSAQHVLLLPIDSSNASWNNNEPDEYYGSIGPICYRQYGGFVNVTTPAGNFNTIKLHEDDVVEQADQYFSSKGLIQQIQYVVTSFGYKYSNVYGYTRRITLVSVNF